MSEFEEAKAVRAGERDDAIPDFAVITGWIQRVPLTWLPGLFHAIAFQCAIKQVFKPGGMRARLDYVEKIAAEGPDQVLRDDGGVAS